MDLNDYSVKVQNKASLTNHCVLVLQNEFLDILLKWVVSRKGRFMLVPV